MKTRVLLLFILTLLLTAVVVSLRFGRTWMSSRKAQAAMERAYSLKWTNVWNSQMSKLGLGFHCMQLTTQDVETLLIPFGPSPTERAAIVDAYFSRKRPFNGYVSNALGSDRFMEFQRATCPGRYAVAELVRIHGLKPETVDEACKLFTGIRQPDPLDFHERIDQGMEIAKQIRGLFPGVSPGDLLNLALVSLPHLFPAGFEEAYYAEIRKVADAQKRLDAGESQRR